MSPLYRPESSKIGQKIEQLAKNLPAPLSWLVPDPYDPSSYVMPIGGLTKSQVLKKVPPLLNKKVGPSEWIENFLRKVPKGAYEKIQDLVDLVEGSAKLGKSKAFFTEGGGKTIVGFHVNRPAAIGLRKGEAGIQTAFHEFGHEIFDRLPYNERKTLWNWWDKLPDNRSKMYFDSLEEMFSEAYNSYLSKSHEFTEYPEVIKHYIKKYHKLMR